MAKKEKKVAAAKTAAKPAAKAAKEIVNKSMLVDAVAAKLEGAVSKKDTKAVLDALLVTVVDSVRKGGEVRLVGFGTFKQSHRAARTGRNPQTGAALQIKASDAFTFKSSIKF